MDLKMLTAEMNKFVSSRGWYDDNSPKPQTPRNLAISLSLESAEVLEHFQWREDSGNLDELQGELADVALYLLQLASVTGIDLEQAIIKKLELNYGRTWSTPNFTLKEGSA